MSLLKKGFQYPKINNYHFVDHKSMGHANPLQKYLDDLHGKIEYGDLQKGDIAIQLIAQLVLGSTQSPYFYWTMVFLMDFYEANRLQQYLFCHGLPLVCL